MLYAPGNEPEELKKYLNMLMRELHEKFPDDLIVMDMWDHERWDKLAGFLVQKLGYPNGRSFLNAYGFEVFVGSEPQPPVQRQTGSQHIADNGYPDTQPIKTQAQLPQTRISEQNSPQPRYEQSYQAQEWQSQTNQPQARQTHKRLSCPNCGSTDVTIETFQEDLGTTTISKTRSKYKEAGHGCLWWLLIGWWWWIVDLFLWIVYFPFRLLFQIFKRKKYKGKSTTISQSRNEVAYKKVFTCQSCGHSWIKQA